MELEPRIRRWAFHLAPVPKASQVCGFRIRLGSTVLTSQWATHRSPLYWEQAEKFDPPQFTPEHRRGRHDYAYYPFGVVPECVLAIVSH